MKKNALVFGILLISLLVVPVHGYPGEDYTKILVLHLNFSHDQITEQSVEMQYRASANPRAPERRYTGQPENR